MSIFKNVSVAQAANVYFDGNVSSRTLEFADGTKKTLGVMLPGEYTFNTADAENMDFCRGEFEVKLPGSDSFVAMSAPCDFDVPANSAFTIRVKSISDYCCSFIK